MLQEGLLQFFLDSALDSSVYPPQYQQLLQQQHAIGWNNFLCGKFSKDWRYLQEQYCPRHHVSMTHTQKQWLTKLLRTLWTCIHDLWSAQNHDHHGRSSKEKYQATLQQSQRTMRALYLLCEKVLSKDQDIFYSDLKTHLQQPLHELNAWMMAHQGLIAYSV
jgi:hypothetical protein